MKIALIGYGKMGKEIEEIAIERGHKIVSIIDVGTYENFDSPAFKSADVAIEFSRPDSAFENFKKCFALNMPVVSGTTGWLEHLEEIKRACKDGKQTFFYASNYSLGVNIFFALNKYLARMMNSVTGYDVDITELHHIHKLDAPSGTAITLAEGIIDEYDAKTKWALDKEESPTDLVIHSIREGEAPGMHKVSYESLSDIISIKHDSKNRKGLALGAVLAAEYTRGRKGFLEMDDMLNF